MPISISMPPYRPPSGVNGIAKPRKGSDDDVLCDEEDWEKEGSDSDDTGPDHIAREEELAEVGEAKAEEGIECTASWFIPSTPGEPSLEDIADEGEWILTRILPSSEGVVSNEMSRSPSAAPISGDAPSTPVNSSFFMVLELAARRCCWR